MLFIKKKYMFQDMNTKKPPEKIFEKEVMGYMTAQEYFNIIKFYQV